MAALLDVRRRMVYRYQDGERWPGQTIQLRLAHLSDVVVVLRTSHTDHAIVRWFTQVRDDGQQPFALFPPRWRPLDAGPQAALVMARADRVGPEPKMVLRRAGRNATLALVHEVIEGFGLEEVAQRTGMDRIRLQRYRRGEAWPSRDTQREFRDLLATLDDPLPTP